MTDWSARPAHLQIGLTPPADPASFSAPRAPAGRRAGPRQQVDHRGRGLRERLRGSPPGHADGPARRANDQGRLVHAASQLSRPLMPQPWGRRPQSCMAVRPVETREAGNGCACLGVWDLQGISASERRVVSPRRPRRRMRPRHHPGGGARGLLSARVLPSTVFDGAPSWPLPQCG